MKSNAPLATGQGRVVAEAIRVFVDGRAVDVAPGATVLDAIRACDAELALAVEGGTRGATDSRGLPIPGDAALSAGSIVRTAALRPRDR